MTLEARMPRANRFFVPGYIWHITHRCHRKQFLLELARDRRRWLHWLRIAVHRYRLCVLNYVATSNHVHLLVRDDGRGEIVSSMRLAAARIAQEYNHRNDRHGAFWQDRYHATAVDTESHLDRCFTYIDLNMVRAGAVNHPLAWNEGGYRELQGATEAPPIIDVEAVARLSGCHDLQAVRAWRAARVDEAIQHRQLAREAEWTERAAVGRKEFLDAYRARLGPRAIHRRDLVTTPS